MVLGNLGGGVDTSNSDVWGAKYPGKHNTKNSHTQKDSHYSLYIQTNPVPCTQTTLITIIQLLPGARVISHIALIYK